MNGLKIEDGLRVAIQRVSKKEALPEAFQYFSYLIGVVFLTYLFGQKIALPIFAVIYLIRWGGYTMRASLGYALVVWIILVGFYDQVMHLFWYPSWLDLWLSSVLPDWIPTWLIA